MKELFDTVFGVLLSPVERHYKMDLISKYSSELIPDPFLRKVNEACADILGKGQDPSVLTVVTFFRENNIYQKDTPIKISQITSYFKSTDVLHLNGIIEGVQYYERLRRAKKMVIDLGTLIETENFTDSKFLDILENGRKLASDNNFKPLDNVELWSKVMNKHDDVANGADFGLQLPFNCLRNAVALEPVDFMVVGARPAMGKTAFSVALAVKLARQGKKVALFALEMSAEQIMRRIMGNIAKVDTMSIRYGKLSEGEKRSLYRAQEVDYLKNIVIFEGSHSINEIYTKVSDMKITQGLDIVIVDYLQKVISKKPSRYEQVTEVSNKLKALTSDSKIPIIAMAQLSRDSGRSGKLPILPDLRESGEIEQDASVVAFLHRPEYYGEDTTSSGNSSAGICEFLIAKNREGIVDVFELEVNLATSDFNDLNSFERLKTTIKPVEVDYNNPNPF
jgi:replicative DNA helicase